MVCQLSVTAVLRIAHSRTSGLQFPDGKAGLLHPHGSGQNGHEFDPVVPEGKPNGATEVWLFRAGKRNQSRRARPDRSEALRAGAAGPATVGGG